MRAPLAVVFVLVVSGCPLPSNVVYRCEPDATCADGFSCAADGWCYPSAQVLADGGVMPPPVDAGGDPGRDGGCVPLTAAEACMNIECGFVSDGCGGQVDCARCPAPLECGVQQANTCGVPSLCLPDGWCWENPLPQGYGLNASLRLDARHQWFVGENGTVLFFDGERSRLEPAPAPPNVDLLAIGGTAANDLYVVGEGATILHFDGATWEREKFLGLYTGSLHTVWSFGGGNAIAAGALGRVLWRNPGAPLDSRWAVDILFPASAADVVSVFSDGNGAVYAVLRNGQLLTRPSATPGLWTRLGNVPMGATNVGLAINDRLVFGGGIAGVGSVAERDDAGTWRTLVDGGTAIFDVVPAEGGLIAFGRGDEVSWVDDAGVTVVPMPVAGWETGAWVGGERLLLGGPFGSMAQVDRQGGFVWVSTERPTLGLHLNAVCGVSPSQLYALGGTDSPVACNTCNARWLERTLTPSGALWAPHEFQLGSTTRLLHCYAENAERVWMTGNDSKFVYLRAGVPERGDFTGTFPGVYRGGWGTPDAGYYFARSNQELTFSWNGFDTFQPEGFQAQGPIESVWGLDESDLLSVGQQGSVSWWDGASWLGTKMTTAGGQGFNFEAVHGVRLATGERRYVAAGTLGQVLSIVGDAGVLKQASAGVDFNATWVSPSGAAWSVGQAADGGAYVAKTDLAGLSTPGAGPSPRELRGVYGLPASGGGQSVWVVGVGGLILRRDVP